MSEPWHFLLTKLDRTPVSGGEIANAYERKYVANLSKPSTASFNIRKDNKILPYLFEDESKLLQVWQGNRLEFNGPVISANYQAQDGSPATIAVTAADASWRLSRRLSGKSEKGEVYTSTDKLAIARAIVSARNTDSPLGIITNSLDLSGTIGSYTAGPYKETLACINELAHGIDGFDWYMEPLNETSGGVPIIGRFRGAAVVGEEKPKVFFEHGVGRRNMRSLGFLRDISTEIDRAYQISDNGLEPSAENPTPVVSATDAPTIAARTLLEEVVELAGVNNVTLRTEWAEENVRVRKDPRRVLAMTSDIDDGTGRVPKFGTDYDLGDRVQARAIVEGNTLFNGQVRVFSVEVQLNNAGTANVTPILVEEA